MPKLRIRPEGGDVTHCWFDKHKGQLWVDVIEEDLPYVEWLVSGEGPKMSDELYDYLIELLEE